MLIFTLVFTFSSLTFAEGTNSAGASSDTPHHWIEVERVFLASSGTINAPLKVSVKSWEDMDLEGLLVEFVEDDGTISTYPTDSKGEVTFEIPVCKNEVSKEIGIYLSRHPEVKAISTIVYQKHLKFFGPVFAMKEESEAKASRISSEKGCTFNIPDISFSATTISQALINSGYDSATSKSQRLNSSDSKFEESDPKLFSNITLIETTLEENIAKIAEGDIAELKRAKTYRIQCIVAANNIFIEETYDKNGNLVGIRLRDDYTNRWKIYAAKIKAAGIEDCIFGFFGIDEPYLKAMICGKSFKKMRAMITELAFQVKSLFPEKRTVESFCITGVELSQPSFNGYPFPDDAKTYYGIPENIDVVGIYNYWASYKIHNPEFDFSDFVRSWSEYLVSLEKHLKSHQKVILVPGTFLFFQNSPNEEDVLIHLASEYYNFAKRKKEVIAIMPFLWTSIPPVIKGMASMPDLWNVWKKIGNEIIND